MLGLTFQVVDNPLSTPDSYAAEFLSKVCDVVAYSALAAALPLNGEADDGLQWLFGPEMVSNYQQLLATVTEKTCTWVSRLPTRLQPYRLKEQKP